jgi:hypothetical protein
VVKYCVKWKDVEDPTWEMADDLAADGALDWCERRWKRIAKTRQRAKKDGKAKTYGGGPLPAALQSAGGVCVIATGSLGGVKHPQLHTTPLSDQDQPVDLPSRPTGKVPSTARQPSAGGVCAIATGSLGGCKHPQLRTTPLSDQDQPVEYQQYRPNSPLRLAPRTGASKHLTASYCLHDTWCSLVGPSRVKPEDIQTTVAQRGETVHQEGWHSVAQLNATLDRQRSKMVLVKTPLPRTKEWSDNPFLLNQKEGLFIISARISSTASTRYVGHCIGVDCWNRQFSCCVCARAHARQFQLRTHGTFNYNK